MKLALQIIVCLVGLVVAYFVAMALLGVGIHLLVLAAILAVIIGICRSVYRGWQAKRLIGKGYVERENQKLEKRTKRELAELKRKINKS